MKLFHNLLYSIVLFTNTTYFCYASTPLQHNRDDKYFFTMIRQIDPRCNNKKIAVHHDIPLLIQTNIQEHQEQQNEINELFRSFIIEEKSQTLEYKMAYPDIAKEYLENLDNIIRMISIMHQYIGDMYEQYDEYTPLEKAYTEVKYITIFVISRMQYAKLPTDFISSPIRSYKQFLKSMLINRTSLTKQPTTDNTLLTPSVLFSYVNNPDGPYKDGTRYNSIDIISNKNYPSLIQTEIDIPDQYLTKFKNHKDYISGLQRAINEQFKLLIGGSIPFDNQQNDLPLIDNIIGVIPTMYARLNTDKKYNALEKALVAIEYIKKCVISRIEFTNNTIQKPIDSEPCTNALKLYKHTLKGLYLQYKMHVQKDKSKESYLSNSDSLLLILAFCVLLVNTLIDKFLC